MGLLSKFRLTLVGANAFGVHDDLPRSCTLQADELNGSLLPAIVAGGENMTLLRGVDGVEFSLFSLALI